MGSKEFDIYIRFNDDNEKDYCFIIDTETTFQDLNEIFETLPISLRPSMLYCLKPESFQYSTAPGYLTANGNVLFTDDATNKKYMKSPASQSKKIADYCWPGQLIVPVWKFKHTFNVCLIGFLLAWLYTDLPDFISPTPGICLTNTVIKIAAWLCATWYDDVNNPISRNLIKETEINASSIPAQIIYFVLHILKIIITYAVIYFGAVNPYGENLLILFLDKISYTSSAPPDLKAEDLMKIGWSGARKNTIHEYKDNYKKYLIDKAGGLVEASKKGLFVSLSTYLGIQLKDGEGYNTPYPSKYDSNDENDYQKHALSVSSLSNYPQIISDNLKLIESDSTDFSIFSKKSPLQFNLSFPYFDYYFTNYLKDKDLLENEDFKNHIYKFNGYEQIKNFRKTGALTCSKSFETFFKAKVDYVPDNESKKVD